MPDRPERRLMLVLDSLKVGGTERQALLLAGELARDGWTVRLVTLTRETPLLEGLSGLPFEVQALSASGPLGMLHALLRAVREFQPDVLQSSSLRPHALALAVRLFERRPRWVVAVRDALPLYRFNRPVYLATDWLVFRARWGVSLFLANSEAALRIKGLSPGAAVRLAPNLIDPRFGPRPASHGLRVRESLGIPADAFVIGAVCNIVPYKGLEDLFSAARSAADEEPRIRLVLVGEARGLYGAALLESGRALLRERLVYAGPRRDVDELLPAFDVLCSASRSEGASNAVMEALLSEVPCVVTDVGDSAKLVGETGWVVPASSPGELSRALLRCARLPRAELAARGAAGRSRIVGLCGPHDGSAPVARTYADLLAEEAADKGAARG